MRSYKIEEAKNKEEQDKALFNFTALDRVLFYFGEYRDLMKFSQNVYTKKLSFDEAKEEQKEMQN